MNRREMLALMAATTGGLVLPRPARAVSAADRKFIFILANGGWDPTRVLYSGFSNKSVEMEDDAEPYSLGDLQLVHHPSRPSVDTFFTTQSDRTVVLNGLQIPAIDHSTCINLLITGSSGAIRPDWAATLGEGRKDRYPLPMILMGGPSFPGDYSSSVIRCGMNGQLVYMLGDERALGNSSAWIPSDESEVAVQDWLRQRMDGYLADSTDQNAAMLEAYASAADRAEIIRTSANQIGLQAANDLEDYIETAVQSLSLGLSRVVSFSFPSAYDSGNWDTHQGNDAGQSALFEVLFSGLNTLMQKLEEEPGEKGKTLADETVVVVMSEMGRQPTLGLGGGKGHWPYTSALLVGPGLDGGRTVGDFDSVYSGVPIVPETGETDESSGEICTATHFGATLMALADVDPEQTIPGASPLTGILT